MTANETPAPQEGPYCVVFSDDAAVEAGCGPLVGQVVFTEVGFGNDKFVEIKNDFDVPVDMEGAGAKLILGEERARVHARPCPTGPGQSTIDPERAPDRPGDGVRDRLRLRPRSPRSRRAASGSS